MDKLQEAVKLAAKIHEKSWDKSTGYYSIPLEKAADQAALAIGFDTRGTQPVYLLLKYCWNDILDWANNKSTGQYSAGSKNETGAQNKK